MAFFIFMKNSEYVIRITTKRGRAWSYLKEGDGWVQKTPAGIARPMTAEQFLSHLLPPLGADQPHLKVTVEPKTPSRMSLETSRNAARIASEAGLSKPGKKSKPLLHHGFVASK